MNHFSPRKIFVLTISLALVLVTILDIFTAASRTVSALAESQAAIFQNPLNSSSPDPSNPCKHIAASHYILGERFDEDPFLIFRLRGKTQEQVMTALRQRRAGEDEPTDEVMAEPEAAIQLEEQMTHFWELLAPLEGFSVAIHPPAIEMPLLKRLGEASFVPARSLEPLLR